jgi:hypothetical protein
MQRNSVHRSILIHRFRFTPVDRALVDNTGMVTLHGSVENMHTLASLQLTFGGFIMAVCKRRVCDGAVSNIMIFLNAYAVCMLSRLHANDILATLTRLSSQPSEHQ